MNNIINDLLMDTILLNDYMAISRYNCSQILQVCVFEQVWGSTNLGFAGVGGSSMTSAWTHVVKTFDGFYHVFFGGRFSYTIEHPNKNFMNDLIKQNMQSIDNALKYYNEL